ncbi:MAG: 4'-phosphopantetheinyl transferase superfamily protein [Methylovirgula sp.]|jgi:4'-phosphopantetheinyl transferase
MSSSRDTIFLTHDLAEAASHKGAFVLVLDLDDPRFAHHRALRATAEDISRAAAYGESARKTFLARRALLRHFLATVLGCGADEVVVGVDPSGAPNLIAPKQNAPPFLSVSGRGSFAAFAAAPTPIGVDLEILGAPDDLPGAMLDESEWTRLSSLNKVARHKAFLEIWTLKEAYLKARRLGLSREPSEIAVAFTDGEIRLSDRGTPVPARAVLCKTEPLRNDTLIIGCVLL